MALHAINHIAYHLLGEALRAASPASQTHGVGLWWLVQTNPSEPLVLYNDATLTYHVILYGLKDMNWKAPFVVDPVSVGRKRGFCDAEYHYYVVSGYQTLKDIQFEDRNQPIKDAINECVLTRLLPPTNDKFTPFKELKSFKLKFTPMQPLEIDEIRT